MRRVSSGRVTPANYSPMSPLHSYECRNSFAGISPVDEYSLRGVHHVRAQSYFS